MKIVIQFVLFLAGFFQVYASDEYKDLPSLTVDEKLIADLRLIANGSFAPLNGFMNESDYYSVLDSGRLANGVLFPLPIVLPIPSEMKEMVLLSGKLLLQNEESCPLAIVLVEDVYSPSLGKECLSSFGTLDSNHPSVPGVLSRGKSSYVGGKVEPLPYLKQLDISEGISSPEETRSFFQKNNYIKVVAFQTRNPIHRAHLALIERCLAEAGNDALLFLHPVVGPTQAEDIPPSVRRKCYEALTPYLNKGPMYLGYLPLAMRMAGPKEALLHAIIRKNYGATHFIVGRDHAGPSSKDGYNQPFYSPYAAQELVKLYEKELGLEILCSKEMVYVAETESYTPQDEVSSNQTLFQISGSELRKKLQAKLPLPEWFSFPEVEQILKDYYSQKNDLLSQKVVVNSDYSSLSQQRPKLMLASYDEKVSRNSLQKNRTINDPSCNLIRYNPRKNTLKSVDSRDQLLVVGCGRSGTKYLATFLQESGCSIGHERPEINGCVSWPMVVKSYSPWGPMTEKTFKHVFHQVRHPLSVISSWVTNLPDLNRDIWVFVRDHVPEIDRNDSLLVHCAKYWYYWNLLAEKMSEWRFKIEDFPKVIEEFAERSELTLNKVLLNKMPRNFHSWKRIEKRVTWDDLKEQIPEDLYQKVEDMSKRYGYTN